MRCVKKQVKVLEREKKRRMDEQIMDAVRNTGIGFNLLWIILNNPLVEQISPATSNIREQLNEEA